jgi:hypothetical protein
LSSFTALWYTLLLIHESSPNAGVTVFTEKPAGAYPGDSLHPGTNEIMDLSDPQQISKQRGGFFLVPRWEHGNFFATYEYALYNVRFEDFTAVTMKNSVCISSQLALVASYG